jgi:hypothetical protein
MTAPAKPALATCLMFAATSLALLVSPAPAQSADATFFLTSSGPGKGGDLGGIEGADRHCQTLAQAAGAGAKTFHAYLSTQAADGKAAVNARDRIGKGPWQNAKGVVIAKDVAELHSASNNLTKQTALTEKGEVNNGRGDRPTAPPSRRARTAPATTGQAAREARRWSATPTAWACATMTPRNPGTPRIPPADRMAAARRPISRAPAAMACSIASR